MIYILKIHQNLNLIIGHGFDYWKPNDEVIDFKKEVIQKH